MTQKEQVLVACHLFEQRLTGLGVPVVVIVGLTDTPEFVLLSRGLAQANNREVIRGQFEELMQTEADKVLKHEPLFVLPRLRECPICLGGGKAVGDSELTAAACGMCNGSGRIEG